MRDRDANRRERRSPYGMRGYSALELAVTLSLASIMAMIALPRWNSQRLQIQTAHRMLIATLRIARSTSITKSVHYKVTFPDSTHITLTKLMESPAGSGTWIADTAATPKTEVLPNITSFSSATIGKAVEFNSRGIVVTNTLVTPSGAAAPRADVTDTFGITKSVEVWPSGQVDEV